MAATTPADGRAAGRHPLDPLSADEIRRAVAILRRDRGVGPRWRFGWIELAEPHKRAARGRAAGEPGERAADVVCWSRDDGRAYKARVSLSGDRVLSWEHCPGVQPNFTVDEYNTCNEALKKDPRVIAALERHGIRDLDRVLIDTWAYGGLLVPEKHRDRRVGWTDIWVYNEDGSNPYANPVTGLHLVVDVNTLELLEIEDAGHERPRTMGEYVPELVPGQRLRDDVKPLRDRPAGGRLVHARGQPAELAALVDAARLQPARGARDPLGRLRGSGPAHPRTAGRPPALVRRDGGALPGPDGRPQGPDGVRHRRVGPRLHDDVARARLRLPGRDRLPGRGGPRLPGRAADDPQRDLRPRGGRRRPVEARRPGRRRGGAALAAARGLLPRHGRQLRVPRLLALLPGREHRVRGPRHRDHGHEQLSRGASSRPTARSSTSAPTRRSTSTSSSRASTWTSTASATRST